jgi:hypothetical protein
MWSPSLSSAHVRALVEWVIGVGERVGARLAAGVDGQIERDGVGALAIGPRAV